MREDKDRDTGRPREVKSRGAKDIKIEAKRRLEVQVKATARQ